MTMKKMMSYCCLKKMMGTAFTVIMVSFIHLASQVSREVPSLASLSPVDTVQVVLLVRLPSLELGSNQAC